jgi:hypothetical protein
METANSIIILPGEIFPVQYIIEYRLCNYSKLAPYKDHRNYYDDDEGRQWVQSDRRQERHNMEQVLFFNPNWTG